MAPAPTISHRLKASCARAETVNVKHLPPVISTTPARWAVLTLAATFAGCSSVGGLFSGEAVDYRNGGAVAGKTLDVPPDLTQLARDSRYQVQGGVVTASGAAATRPGAVSAVAPGVAPLTSGDMRIEREGQQRWLVVPQTPEQLWPALKTFWIERGFVLDAEDPKTGVMETNWSENRAKLPADVIRNTIGRVLGNLYDTGERDRYRTRVERTAAGSEIYISHRGVAEVAINDRSDGTTWRVRPNDPQLEAEFIAQLMVALGAKNEAARAAVAAAGSPAVAAQPAAGALPARTAYARAVGGADSAALEVDDPFDRAWRRVGLALDRGGFSVDDRDRANGLYYVRYVDPKSAGQEEPGFWARLFGNTTSPNAAVRYRIALKADGAKTNITVLTSSGGADVGDIGRRIAARLVDELR